MEKKIIEEDMTKFTFSDLDKKIRIFKAGVVSFYKICLKEPNNFQYFALKKINLKENSNEEFIRKELFFLQQIKFFHKKPQSMGNYYGHCKTSSPHKKKFSFYLFFDFKENLKELIKQKQKENKRFSPGEIYDTLQFLLNVTSFLQLNLITLKEISPKMIFYSILPDKMEIAYNSLTLIDFWGSKYLMNFEKNPLAKKNSFEEYLCFFEKHEEDSILNPIKCNVFSMGLTILAMATLKLPKKVKDFKEIESQIKMMIELMKSHYNRFCKEYESKEKIKIIADFLMKTLINEKSQQINFIELFCEFHGIDKKNRANKKFLLDKIILLDVKHSNENLCQYVIYFIFLYQFKLTLNFYQNLFRYFI